MNSSLGHDETLSAFGRTDSTCGGSGMWIDKFKFNFTFSEDKDARKGRKVSPVISLLIGITRR